MTTSSPSGGVPFCKAFKLNGTPITQRALVRLGWQRDNVTVPMTSAMRMTVELPERTRDPGRASRRARHTHGAENLPHFKERSPGNLHRDQVCSQGQGR